MASQVLCLSLLIILPYVPGKQCPKNGSLKKLYWAEVIWGLLTKTREWGYQIRWPGNSKEWQTYLLCFPVPGGHELISKTPRLVLFKYIWQFACCSLLPKKKKKDKNKPVTWRTKVGFVKKRHPPESEVCQYGRRGLRMCWYASHF